MLTLPITHDTLIASIVAGGFIGGICLLSWHITRQEGVRRFHLHFLRIFFIALHQAGEWCENGRRAILSWRRQQMRARFSSMRPSHWVVSFLCLVLSLILLFCEASILGQVFAGFGREETLLSAASPGTLLAIAIWAAAVTWGIFLFEALGVTRLQPWMHGMSGFSRKVVAAFCILGIMGSLLSQVYFASPVSTGVQDDQAWLLVAAVLAAIASINGAGLFSMNGSLALLHLLLLWGISTVAALPLAAAEFVFLVAMRLMVMADGIGGVLGVKGREKADGGGQDDIAP